MQSSPLRRHAAVTARTNVERKPPSSSASSPSIVQPAGVVTSSRNAIIAMVCEIILSALVMLTILLTANELPVVGKQAALAVGLAVAACGFFAGPISGASMNPARPIAPQLLSGQIQLVWIYAVGPLLGTAVAVAIHIFLVGPPNQKERKAAVGKG